MWTQWVKERVGGIERVALTYTLPCVKEIAHGRLLYNTGSSAWFRDNLEGWVWVGAGHEREVQETGDICILTADARVVV